MKTYLDEQIEAAYLRATEEWRDASRDAERHYEPGRLRATIAKHRELQWMWVQSLQRQ